MTHFQAWVDLDIYCMLKKRGGSRSGIEYWPKHSQTTSTVSNCFFSCVYLHLSFQAKPPSKRPQTLHLLHHWPTSPVTPAHPGLPRGPRQRRDVPRVGGRLSQLRAGQLHGQHRCRQRLGRRGGTPGPHVGGFGGRAAWVWRLAPRNEE